MASFWSLVSFWSLDAGLRRARRCQVSGFRLNIGVSEKLGRASARRGEALAKTGARRIPIIAYYRIWSARWPTLLIRAVPDT